MWYVYIIECEDGKLYGGLTDNVERSFKEHQHKGSHFTSYNPTVKMHYKEPFQNKHDAAKREKQIKGWTRKKKLALIQSDLTLLYV